MVNSYKTQLLIISFFTLQSFCCLSQSKESCVSINFGVSAPTGVFANKQPVNGNAGFAGTGVYLDFSYVKYISGNFGIIVTFAGTNHHSNHTYLIDEISGRSPNEGVVFEDWWISENYLMGVVRSFNLKEKFQIESALMIGMHKTLSPGFRAYNLDGPPGSPRNIKQYEKESKLTIGLAGRLRLRYDYNETVCFFSSIDFLWANPKFEDRETTFNFERIREVSSFRQNVSALNFSLGVGYTF